MTLQYVPVSLFTDLVQMETFGTTENRTVYFVENYMIVKLKYCIIRCTILFFSNDQIYYFNSEYFTFKLVVKLLSALSVYMVFGLRVFLVISNIRSIWSFLTLCIERPCLKKAAWNSNFCKTFI